MVRVGLGGRGGRTAAVERGKRRQRSEMVGRQDGGSGRVSAGGTIEGANGNVWVRQRWLGVDDGGGGGWRSKVGGGGIVIL